MIYYTILLVITISYQSVSVKNTANSKKRTLSLLSSCRFVESAEREGGGGVFSTNLNQPSTMCHVLLVLVFALRLVLASTCTFNLQFQLLLDPNTTCRLLFTLFTFTACTEIQALFSYIATLVVKDIVDIET
jgi:hypothetical protein